MLTELTELGVINPEPDTHSSSQTLYYYVKQFLEQYFNHLGDTPPSCH